MSVYKEIHKYNFENEVKEGQNTSLFYRINKHQDLAGIVIPNDENQDKTVSPTEETQTITPDLELGYTGLNSVTIEGIQAGLIQIEPSASNSQIIIPPEGTYYNRIEVPQITHSIDDDIRAGNIRYGVDILGVVGTFTGGRPISPTVSNEILDLYDNGSIDEDPEDPDTNILEL